MQRSPKEDVMVQYPKATWKPLQGHSSAGTLAQRTEVILHITDGDSEVGAFNLPIGSPDVPLRNAAEHARDAWIASGSW